MDVNTTTVSQFIRRADGSWEETPSWQEEGGRDDAACRVMGRATSRVACLGPGPTSSVTATWIHGLRGAVAVELAYGSGSWAQVLMFE